jgi:hypothetical protein
MTEPFGYKQLGGRRYPREAEVETVRWIFWRFVHDGWSLARIAQVLDRERSCGKRWDPSAVRRILWRSDYKSGEGGQWPDGTRIVEASVFDEAQVILRRLQS